jgi:hypothetical protein
MLSSCENRRKRPPPLLLLPTASISITSPASSPLALFPASYYLATSHAFPPRSSSPPSPDFLDRANTPVSPPLPITFISYVCMLTADDVCDRNVLNVAVSLSLFVLYYFSLLLPPSPLLLPAAGCRTRPDFLVHFSITSPILK